MLYYLGTVSFFLFFSLIGWVLKQPRIFVVLAFVPMVLIAILRGDVGTDTAVYLQVISTIVESESYTKNFEPLFEYSVLFLSVFVDDARAILAVLGVIATGVFLWGGLRNNVNPFLFCIFLVPVFYFDMVMNGIRYGISFSIILLAATFLLQKRIKLYFVLVLIASAVQISGGMLGFAFYILFARRWKWMIIFSMLSVTCFVMFFDYFMAKFDSYKMTEATSIVSGLSTLLVSLSILCIWSLDVKVRDGAIRAITIFLVLTIAMFGVVQFSYAGLRLQQLVFFLMIMYMISHMQVINVSFSRSSKALLILVSLIACGFRLRNFSDGEGVGPSPFLPYHFFWH